MTPFMLAVQAVLDGDDTAPELETALSRADSLAAATDYQVVIRSLAEQLVSEANAVLRQHGDVISLVDECGGALVFTLGYRDRGARVETVMAGRMAYGRLLIPGQVDDEPRQLATGDEIQTLVLRLLTDVPHH
jgi:hypothetical protein